MVNLQLGWQESATLAAGLVALRYAAVHSRKRRVAPYLQESAIIAGLYTLWQLAASLSVVRADGAYRRGRWIEHVQHDLWLPSERSAQQLITTRPLLAQACNLYYASMHFAALGAFLLWLFIRHRSAYPLVRNVLVMLTAISLVIQFVPVAPPRLLPELGFVDTAAQYGQSVYNLSGVTVDELAAMPSVHVGWALLIGWAVLKYGRGPWRSVVLLHPILTIFVVAATANHFWLDGVVAGAILAASIATVTTLMPRPRPPELVTETGDRVEVDSASRAA